MPSTPAADIAPTPTTRSTSSPLTWPLGVHLDGAGGGTALVWAPRAARVELCRMPVDPAAGDAHGDEPVEVIALDEVGRGYHAAPLGTLRAGDRYRFRLHRVDGTSVDRADPASRFQPDGVHGPSAVDDPAGFTWTDAAFRAPPLADQVMYELHVGTFSPQGTFDGAVGQLDHLVALGITTIELMPVWQFPGGRNWGYDGVLPFAVQDTYGGPDGLRRLVDAAHARGIAVILDVVHNHFGPEGNHLGDFGPYLSEHRMTPWGPGLNADGHGADAVRRYVTEHLTSFVRDLHLDGFRLDAVHGIVDQSATHLLEQLATAVHAEAAALGRVAHLIAESDLCDARLLRDPQAGGYGLDAQWADDLHHAVHVALTGEQDGYYQDHTGLGDLERMLRDRYVYAGRYSSFRERTIGRPARDVPYDRFVVCVQNHDQTGNRMLGERLTALTDEAGLRLAAGVVLTSPYVPMLFMGEEFAEPNPFQYFVSHTDEGLIEAVRTGRREEFAFFAHQGEAPDPQDEATFARSRIDVGRTTQDGTVHARMFALYRELIALRRAVPLLRRADAPDPAVTRVPGAQALVLHREDPGSPDEQAVLIAINAEPTDLELDVQAAGPWQTACHTDDEAFGGPGRGPAPSVAEDGRCRVHLPARSVQVLVRATGPHPATSPTDASATVPARAGSISPGPTSPGPTSPGPTSPGPTSPDETSSPRSNPSDDA
ncbi:MAG: malto-oligosyltrehalose trehalohydrolase [Nitriliruptoraceae bacterium]|nr:malto-oligosyltrehalose trehalohydrolase [Nitriliruptoraceae bacterium]